MVILAVAITAYYQYKRKLSDIAESGSECRGE
jgi:hypothetical protein